jgi:hypothetical protein
MPLITDIATAQKLTTTSYLIFWVQPNLDVGYSFHVLDPLPADDPALMVQFAGFMVILSGLVWNSRHFIAEQTKLLHNWIRTKK